MKLLDCSSASRRGVGSDSLFRVCNYNESTASSTEAGDVGAADLVSD
jgi:hypothetical protein